MTSENRDNQEIREKSWRAAIKILQDAITKHPELRATPTKKRKGRPPGRPKGKQEDHQDGR